MGLKRRAPLLLALLGVGLSLHGLWIPAKAVAAQWLLERAWQASLAADTPAPPWPWADTRPAGRLRVPALAVDQVVLTGDSGRTLAFAPGLVQAEKRAPLQVISGHKDTHFAFLQRLGPGALLEWQTPSGERERYRVTATEVIDSRRVRLDPSKGDKGLLLVTCYPFGGLAYGGPMRYLVWAAPATADRVQF